MEKDLRKLGFNIRSKSSDNLGKTIYENRSEDSMDKESMKLFKYNLDYDLDSLKDVDKGANLLIRHIDNRSHIVIVSDYDSD